MCTRNAVDRRKGGKDVPQESLNVRGEPTDGKRVPQGRVIAGNEAELEANLQSLLGRSHCGSYKSRGAQRLTQGRRESWVKRFERRKSRRDDGSYPEAIPGT